MMIHPQSKIAKKIFGVIFTIAILLGAYLLFRTDEPSTYIANQTQPQPILNNNLNTNTNKEEEIKVPLPAKFSLTVPFTAQAPTGNWDQLHDEACEEASSIMAYAFFNDISLNAPLVETEITKLTKWQQENFGYYLSISTEETAKMIQANYDLKTELTKIDEETIKRALVDGKLVILPANGKMLGNPNFTPPGPIYHMLVITGYDEQGFITNDPGTRKGLNYRYTYATLQDATGNWSAGTKAVDLDNKKIIIVSKN